MKKAIVVGASRGLGAALVKELVENGYKVAAVSRNFDADRGHSDSVLQYSMDATEFSGIEENFAKICADLGGLDLIIYCAGLMHPVEKDEFSIGKDLDMLSVNCAGPIMWLDLAASRFQGAKHGCIIGVGSVAGDRGRAGQPVYNASKAFFHSYLESLRNRLCGLGVSVVTIKPGPLATDMTRHLDQSKMLSPDIAASKIIAKIGKNGEFYLSPIHKIIFGIIHVLPGWLMRKLPL